jgi:hypothetical protein
MKGQSEMKIGASLSRTRTRKSKTSRIPLIVYGWLFLVTVLAGILFYVSIYYTKVQLIKGKPLTGLARDYQSTANGLRSGQQGSDGVGNDSRKETLVVSTLGHGDIHIVLRPDLSQESVAYIREMAKLHSCPICNFYRADERILQGIIKSDNIKKVEKKGKCPLAYQGKSQPDCPAWDPDCGCHGYVQTFFGRVNGGRRTMSLLYPCTANVPFVSPPPPRTTVLQ